MISQREAHERCASDPSRFWLEAAQAISWDRMPTIGCETRDSPSGRWFADGRLNACYNAVDRHVDAGRGEQLALVQVSAITGSESRYTYRELRDEVARVAGALQRLGVVAGDRVILYMPMVPEAVFAMLACARLGAIHSVVFGGFAARELAVRIDDAAPRVVLSASCGLEPGRVVDYHSLLVRALDLAVHKPAHCVVLQREQSPAALRRGLDLDWHDFIDGAVAAAPVSMPSQAPLYVCPARFDWSSVEVSLGGPFAGYRDDPRAGGEPPGLGRRGSIAESAVRSNSVVVMSPLLDQHLGLA